MNAEKILKLNLQKTLRIFFDLKKMGRCKHLKINNHLKCRYRCLKLRLLPLNIVQLLVFEIVKIG